MDIPRFSAKSLQITDVLHPGVVYLGEGSQSQGKVIVKVIYSGMASERYGWMDHKHMESKDMAPKYYNTGNVVMEIPYVDQKPIEFYHVMEYLPPPSNGSAGWMSLFDIEKQHRRAALDTKKNITTALHEITDVLGQAGLVHGDLRPNNLLICVKITDKGCSIQHRPDSDPPLPYLKVIDFDWAGEAGKVEYPPHRNLDIEWPGENGSPFQPMMTEL